MKTVLAAALLAGAASPALAQVQSVDLGDMTVVWEEKASGLVHPWGLAFLPDGRAMITERPGRLRILSKDGALSEPVSGVPEVHNVEQGGLLDVAVDPDFPSNRWVYLSYARPVEGGAVTALGRGRMTGSGLEDFEVIFSQDRAVDNGKHFGGRIEFDDDGHVFLTTGERYQFDPAQDLSNTLGTTLRLHRDGSIPEDNPFVGEDGADAIWSYGHRNIEAAAHDGDRLWVAEMGPLGGDELNRIEPGANYGWPEVSAGSDYDGAPIPDPSTTDRYTRAELTWTPVISPSGMIVYDGDMFGDWAGHALIGGLTANGVVIVDPEAGEEIARIPMGARIREVTQGPDGSVWVTTDQDDGKVWRVYARD
ncbi:MAG: PQQ-dependent sugar dehydrogenase [Oceanicaulis sp.]